MQEIEVKKGERTYIQRQFVRWNKYWLHCKDPEKRDKLFKQSLRVGEIMIKEMEKQRD